MLSLDSKRVRKSSGTKKDKKRRESEKSRRSSPRESRVSERDLTKDSRGVAKSQANRWAKNKKSGRDTFWTDFKSTTIDGIDYDSEKKQLWIRFLGGDVYTYFDVPINIARGFISTPSKGHYFWEKIRKNKHIKYQKLTASRHWIELEHPIDLSNQEEIPMRKFQKKVSYLSRKINSARMLGEMPLAHARELTYRFRKVRTEATEACYQWEELQNLDEAWAILTYLTRDSKELQDYCRNLLDSRSVNSSKLTVSAEPAEDADEDFLEEMSSIITLDSGDTIDISMAYLAYNPDTQELILTDDDESELEEGFTVIGRVTPEEGDLSSLSEEDEDEGSESTEESESEEAVIGEEGTSEETEESEGSEFPDIFS